MQLRFLQPESSERGAEKAGMRKVVEQQPSEEAKRVADALSGLGFDLKLLGNQRYVSDKLRSLGSEQLEELKETFIKNDHPRFRKEIAANYHMPYGTATAFAEGVKNANIERIAKLVKIVGMLLQTKVYLFWNKR